MLEIGEKIANQEVLVYSTAGEEQTTLQALAAKYPQGLVLYFYPKAMTPGCTTQACDFRDHLNYFHHLGYEVLGISPDQGSSLEKFIIKEGLNFYLHNDPEHVLLEKCGAWGIKKNYGKEYLGVIRSTIVVDKDLVVRWKAYNVRAKGHVARLGKELAALAEK